MAIWQVKFILLPRNLFGDFDDIPKKLLISYVDEIDGSLPQYDLPDDYHTQLNTVLPKGKGWSPNMEVWGNEESDDIQIWRQSGKVASINIRIDVRKLDDELLSHVLTLADNWSCVLVETRYLTVCKPSIQHLRSLIAGHPHSRAIRDPVAWLPVLADEVKRKEEHP